MVLLHTLDIERQIGVRCSRWELARLDKQVRLSPAHLIILFAAPSWCVLHIEGTHAKGIVWRHSLEIAREVR